MEDRAGVVLDRAAGGVGTHEQEAARAERLVGALGLQPVDRLTTVVDGALLVLVVLLVLGGDHAVLEDAVEVGLDVVGGDEVVVVVLFLLLGAGALALAGPDGGVGLGVVVVVVLELGLVLFDLVGLELLVGLGDQLVLVEVGVFQVRILELGVFLRLFVLLCFDFVRCRRRRWRPSVSSLVSRAAGY